MNFGDRLTNAVAQVGVPIGIGLDPHLDRLPKYLQEKYQNKQGEEFFDIGGEINELLGNKNNNVVVQNSVNPELWRGSLDVTKKYPLKINFMLKNYSTRVRFSASNN